MPLPVPNLSHHSYGDYCTWPEDQRYELIDGMAYAMAPSPTSQHLQHLALLDLAIDSTLRGCDFLETAAHMQA